MRKQSPVRLLFIALSLFLLLPQTFVSGNARAVNMVYGAIQIQNRNDADAAFSCDVKLSGKRIQGSVFAVLFSESEQMKLLADYPAKETVRVSLKDVSKTDYIKILWTDEQHMPLANPVVLRMEENNAAAYENFTKQLAASLQPYQGGSASSDAENPYALARLLVSCDALPDLSEYKGKATTVSGPDNLHILQFYDPVEASKCKNYLESFPSVRYVEPDAIMQANATESGASSSPHSWGVSKTGSGEYAENLRQRGDAHGVIVAVVDSGVESSHPFLKNRLITGYDFIQYDEIPQDEHGHGTHVTGTIVDCTPDMDVKIMPVRVLDAFASGSYLSIANGIRYAADHGANIINLSLGSTNHSQTIDEAVNYALSKNITVVAAAGNKMGNVDYFCPAHMEDCITVAAVDSDLKRYELSNYGDAIDIAAPGVGIESSILKSKYGEMNGTSMATPHVSAAAALLMSERGTGQTPFQISSLLRDAATDVGETGKDVYFGAGFLNMRPFIVHSAYAMLYADGELVFQKNNTPAPDRELIKSYPVATSGDGGGQYAAWHDRHSDIRKVTFAESIRPTSTALWFYGCEDLSEVQGIENLDAGGLTDMSQMFARCGSLKSLDLSGLDTGAVSKMNSMFFHCEALTELNLTNWDTKNVTDTRDMFIGCAALKTVYASESFSTAKTTDSEGMFQGCHALIGGQNTPFDNAHTGKEYARIDGGTSAPGYFTDKNATKPKPEPEPSTDIYAVLYADGELVFQNNNRTASGRTVIDVYKVKDYTWYFDVPWYEQRDTIQTVSFANRIQPQSTAYWFAFCSHLTSIQGIERLDTSQVTDMQRMFSWCTNLTELDVSGFDTSRVTNMSDIFEYCGKLTNLDVSGFDTSHVTSMSCMFQGCNRVISLNVSGFDTSQVEYMFGMFWGCSRLTDLDVSSFDTSNVTDMSRLFEDCSSLTSMDLQRLDTRKVTDMSSMFSGCGNLTSLNVSSFDTSQVTNMGGMFFGCRELISLDLSSFNTVNLKEMVDISSTIGDHPAGMFEECSSLRTIYVSQSFTVNKVEESECYVFGGCTSLVGSAGTKYDSDHTGKDYALIDGGTSAPGYFSDKNAPIPSTDIYAVLYADGELVFQNNDRTDSGRSVTDVYKVDESYSKFNYAPWHEHHDNITTINFADQIKPQATAYWFYQCFNVNNIQNIERIDTDNVTDMSFMFCICRGLTSLDVSGFNTSNVTNMDYMFYGCKGLTSLDISNFNTANVTSMDYMFCECSGLTSLDVSAFNSANLTNVDSMFKNCNGLLALDFGEFNTENIKSMWQMFSGCSALDTLDISSFSTANVTNMDSMFYECSQLKTIYASELFITDNVVSSTWEMFYKCTSLVGGAGTKYDSAHRDKACARIDGGPDAPGYFTRK